MTRSLITDGRAGSCYFRTAAGGSDRKALIQITERCNLRCAHCFVSATTAGRDLSLNTLTDLVLPRLLRARVSRLTLTGGEPFVHPDLLGICRTAVNTGLPVGICTNGTLVTDAQIRALRELGSVHVNVSFDGFRAESHDRFRGRRSAFATTLDAARRLAGAQLLQGILSTPNRWTTPEEFGQLCEFAVEVGARYVLMNPLSSLGRGVRSQHLAAAESTMRAIRAATTGFEGRGLEVVHVRFPNDDRPLGGCPAGSIVYVFADGDTAVCPYLVFAARTPGSAPQDIEFLVGNVLREEIADPLDRFDLSRRCPVTDAEACRSCPVGPGCSRGCPAAIVARGERLGSPDLDQCPRPMVGTRSDVPLARS